MIERMWRRVYLSILRDIQGAMEGVLLMSWETYHDDGMVDEALMRFSNEFLARQAWGEYERRLRVRA